MLKKEEKIIIKKFYETKYPKSTHELGLDCCFDYYNAICLKLLRGKSALKEQIEPLPEEIKEKIEQYIKVNENNDYIKSTISNGQSKPN